jgi:Rieske Fe-S protein
VEPQLGECDEGTEPRRRFLTVSGVAMTIGVTTAYGALAGMLGRFVFPAGAENRGWLFVCHAEAIRSGESLEFTTPNGAKIVIARQISTSQNSERNDADQENSKEAGESAEARLNPTPTAQVEEYLALSSVCPHLGCRVHWEGAHERFFCPCHNGAFDRQGRPTEGPPLAANQSLIRFPLKIERGLLYLEAPLSAVIGQVAEQPKSVTAKVCQASSAQQEMPVT